MLGIFIVLMWNSSYIWANNYGGLLVQLFLQKKLFGPSERLLNISFIQWNDTTYVNILVNFLISTINKSLNNVAFA